MSNEIPEGLLEHPWVEAVLRGGQPKPVPSALHIEPVEVEQNGTSTDAVLLTITDATGVKTVFLSLSDLNMFITQGQALLDYVNNKQKIVIPGAAEIAQVMQRMGPLDGTPGLRRV
jgi:hypothetical protein